MQNFIRHKQSSFRMSRAHRFMQRHRRPISIIAWAAGSIGIVMILIQSWYGQQHLVRPLTTVGVTSLGSQTRAQAEAAIHDAYSGGRLDISIKGQPITAELEGVGVAPNTVQLVAQLVDYPVWQRFIPFTLFAHAPARYEVKPVIDQSRFSQFVQSSVAPICHLPAVNARVEVVEGQLNLRPAKSGADCSAELVAQRVLDTQLDSDGMSVSVIPSETAPVVTTASAQRVLVQAEQLVNRQLQIQIVDTVVSPSTQQIASWLTFEADPKTGATTVGISTAQVITYIETLQKSVYTAPGETVIALVDGEETSRLVGANGRGIKADEGAQLIRQQLQAGDGSVTLQPSVLPPTERFVRTYTKTEAGLQALVTSLGQKGDTAISVQHIGGRGWRAAANGDKTYVPASTYKIFVAYAVLKQIESGAMGWDDRATGGQTVSDCFDTMIINSDNPCSEWFGEKIGWKNITAMIHGAGVSRATSLYTKAGFVATANDEALFLTKLESGALLSPSSTSRLLDIMKRQVYRAGIPAGAGLSVANKVGFLGGLLHDAGIVYAPSGTYALVIMTSGSSWAQIADIARQINAHLR